MFAIDSIAVGAYEESAGGQKHLKNVQAASSSRGGALTLAVRIASPVSGTIIALDPDIPPARQRLFDEVMAPYAVRHPDVFRLGATEADLEPLAHDAFHDVCTPGNPRQATEEDILAIYKSLM